MVKESICLHMGRFMKVDGTKIRSITKVKRSGKTDLYLLDSILTDIKMARESING